MKVCPEEFSVEPPSNTLQLNDKNSGFNQEDNSNEFNCYKLKKKEEKSLFMFFIELDLFRHQKRNGREKSNLRTEKRKN